MARKTTRSVLRSRKTLPLQLLAALFAMAALTAAVDAVNLGGAGLRNMFGLPRGISTMLSGQMQLASLRSATNQAGNSPGPDLPTMLASLKTGPAETPAEEAQRSIDSATLGVLSIVFNSVSAILYTVSGALATASGTIGLGLEQWGKSTGRIQYLQAQSDFARSVVSDFSSSVGDKDVLGDAAKYVQMWSEVQDALTSGSLQGDIEEQLQKLATASSMLSSVSSSLKTKTK